MSKKFENWEQKYSFEKCGVGREEHRKFLKSYITGERDGFVLNLNGEWGSGKTEFLRRMRTGLMEDDYPVIYIDAWESDFCGNPLLVVASELLEQLKSYFEVNGSDLDAVKDYLGRFVKGSAVAAAGFVSKSLAGDATYGTELMKGFMEPSPKEYLDQIKEGYLDQVKAIQKVREEMEKLSDVLGDAGKKLPVVVLIDELDRCRPSYAIEMLEVIKHFFTTKNFVFVIATDTVQLQHSIRAVYGVGFGSEQYLRRFFNREARLRAPDVNLYVKKYDLTSSDNIKLYPTLDKLTPIQSTQKYLIWGVRAFDLKLRDLDQAVAKLKACLRVISEKSDNNQFVNIFVLIIAILEFDSDHKTFVSRSNNNPLAEWKSVNFDINNSESDIKTLFSNFYALNMNHSVRHLVSTDQYNKREALANEVNKFRLNREKSSGMMLQAEKSILKSYSDETRQDKRWLWHDYKELVSLAYTLD